MDRRGIHDFGEFVLVANTSVVVRAVCRVANDGLKSRIGGTRNADLVEGVPARQESVLASGERIDCLARVGEARRAQSYQGQAWVSYRSLPSLKRGYLPPSPPGP